MKVRTMLTLGLIQFVTQRPCVFCLNPLTLVSCGDNSQRGAEKTATSEVHSMEILLDLWEHKSTL